MGKDTIEIIAAEAKQANMMDYEQARKEFDWSDVEKRFSWHETGKLNLAYEAIDRHATSALKDKIALHYSDPQRDESYTFEQLRRESNKAANMLRKLGIGKGDRVPASEETRSDRPSPSQNLSQTRTPSNPPSLSSPTAPAVPSKLPWLRQLFPPW